MFFLFTAVSQSKLSHLNSNLEAIKTSRLWNLDFLAKTLDQVFIHNAIASSEEGENMLDEIPFIILGNTRKKNIMIMLQDQTIQEVSANICKEKIIHDVSLK